MLPSSHARSSAPAFLFLAGAAAFLGLAGCYRPNLVNGGLACSEAGTCPEGYYCAGAASNRRCYKDGTDAEIPGDGSMDGRTDTPVDMGEAGGGGRDGGMEVHPEAGTDASDTDAGCFTPKPGCSPNDAGICDPYCQTGCGGCNRKCSVNTDRNLTCNMTAGGALKGALERCQIISEGSNNQTDDCQPGLVCVEDSCGRRLCQPFCRSDSECPNAGCTREVGGGHRVCDVPFADSCVPLPGSNNTGCSSVSNNAGCYLSSSHPTRTVCDCPMDAQGANAPCNRSRECLPGLVCVDPNGAGSICLRVCRISGPASDCPSNQTCREYRGASPSNEPHSTYGYCF